MNTYNFNNKITNNPVKKLAKDLFRYFTKGDIQMAKHMKDSHHHYLLRKCKLNPQDLPLYSQ